MWGHELTDDEAGKCTDCQIRKATRGAGIIDPVTGAYPPLRTVDAWFALLEDEWIEVTRDSYEKVKTRLGR